MTSKAWSMGMLVKRAETSKETISSCSCMFNDFSLSVRSFESFTKEEVLPVYIEVIDQEKSQITREAKEAIHIRKSDPELSRNVGKMVIPHVFNSILGVKPRNPPLSLLLPQENRSEDMGRLLT